MERITYRISLDTHRNGVQRTLQGIQTGDNISRRVEISLVEGTETYNLPLDGLEAVMYVLTPSGESPSVNACEINAENNKIIYDLLPTDTLEEGTVSMQLKLIETSMTGAERVLISPKFAIEVWESEVSDSEAESTPTFTALEMALAKAKEVYDSRLIGFEIIEEGEDKGRIIVSYADGTTYESDVIKDALGMIADIGTFVTRAETAAEDAESARDEASGYKDLVEAKVDVAESAKVAAELAKTVSEEAMAETVSAKNVVVEAKTEVLSAKEVAVTSAANALASELNAQTSEADARSSKISAQESAESALSSKTSAQTSAESALSSKNSAENYAKTSQSYAVGGTGARPGEDIDNAKYYKELCQQIAGGLEGGFIPMGTVAFETLATLTPNFGYMYNISNEFVTDNRFKDGPGKRYAAGTNVYFTADSMWDCLSGAIPTINGKNGNSITLDGADLLVSGYTKATSVSDITPNDTINQALGKLEKKDEEKASKATTLSGYGITDAYTKSEVDTELGKKADSSTTLAGYGITNAYTKTETDSKVKTAAAKTGSGTSVTNTIAKSTTFDSAISTLLNNDHALEEKIKNASSGNDITYAQWLQLTAEQKASGDYYVIDWPDEFAQAENIPYGDTTVGAELGRISSNLSELETKVDGIKPLIYDSTWTQLVQAKGQTKVSFDMMFDTYNYYCISLCESDNNMASYNLIGRLYMSKEELQNMAVNRFVEIRESTDWLTIMRKTGASTFTIYTTDNSTVYARVHAI